MVLYYWRWGGGSDRSLTWHHLRPLEQTGHLTSIFLCLNNFTEIITIYIGVPDVAWFGYISYLSKSTLWLRFSTTIANMMSRPKIRIEKYNSCIEQRAEEKNWRLLLLSRYKNPLASHVRTHFFFSLFIRNNYVTYLLLKYSTSPLANRHEICPKKITSPQFWNTKNLGIDGPKEFHAEQALIFV